MNMTTADASRVANKLAKEIADDYGEMKLDLLAIRMKNVFGIEAVLSVSPDGSVVCTGFSPSPGLFSPLPGGVNAAAAEALIDYRRALRGMTSGELKSEQENGEAVLDEGKSLILAAEINRRRMKEFACSLEAKTVDELKGMFLNAGTTSRRYMILSEFDKKFASYLEAKPLDELQHMLSDDSERKILAVSTKSRDMFEARLKVARKNALAAFQKQWVVDHPGIFFPREEPAGEIDEDKGGGGEDEDDQDWEPEKWDYDSSDANNPWYLIWAFQAVHGLLFRRRRAGRPEPRAREVRETARGIRRRLIVFQGTADGGRASINFGETAGEIQSRFEADTKEGGKYRYDGLAFYFSRQAARDPDRIL